MIVFIPMIVLQLEFFLKTIMENFVWTQMSTESYTEAHKHATQSRQPIHPPSFSSNPTTSHPVYSEANPRNHTVSLVNVSMTLKYKEF